MSTFVLKYNSFRTIFCIYQDQYARVFSAFLSNSVCSLRWRMERPNKARFSHCTILTSNMLLEDTSHPLLFVSAHSPPYKSILSHSPLLSSYSCLYNYTVQDIWPELANCGISLLRSLAFSYIEHFVTLAHSNLYSRILVNSKV